jgi:hypothetical protein
LLLGDNVQRETAPSPQISETERLYRASIEREKAAKKAEGLAKLAAWKQDNPELVQAQQKLAKIKRKKRKTKSMTRDRMTWIASTARLSGREIKANKRLKKRIAELEATGLSNEDARKKALAEMRDNPRKDWRAG